MAATKKILGIPLKISLGVLLLGFIFKLLQWPFSFPLMVVSFITIPILYSVRFWRFPQKKFLDYVKMVMVTAWSVNGLFRLFQLPQTILFQILILTCLIIWIIMEGASYFMEERGHKKNPYHLFIWNGLMVVGIISIIAGGISKLLDWEYSLFPLLFGMLLIILYVMKDVFRKEVREGKKIGK
jgi:hypothetical protein